MANTHDKGDLIRVTGTFTDSAGTVQDPTAVYCKYRTPSRTTTTLQYSVDVALKRLSAGIYYVDISATEAGTWHYRFYSTGTGQAAGESSFFVDAKELG